jgi:hypothetical protein
LPLGGNVIAHLSNLFGAQIWSGEIEFICCSVKGAVADQYENEIILRFGGPSHRRQGLPYSSGTGILSGEHEAMNG